MYETDSFLKMLQNHALANAWCLGAPPTQKRKMYLRAPKARAEKNWEILHKFNKRIEGIQPLVYETGSFVKALRNHALTNV